MSQRNEMGHLWKDAVMVLPALKEQPEVFSAVSFMNFLILNRPFKVTETTR